MSQLFTKKSKTHFGITFLHFGQHTFYHLCTKKRCMFLFFWFSKFLCKLRLFRDHSWVDNCNFHDFWKFIISVFENENWLVGGVLERIFTWRMQRYHYFSSYDQAFRNGLTLSVCILRKFGTWIPQNKNPLTYHENRCSKYIVN